MKLVKILKNNWKSSYLFRWYHQGYLVKNVLTNEFCAHLKALHSGHVVLDLGANVGHISELLAKSGAICHSFEPNKSAFNKLSKVASRYSNLQTYNVAAGTKGGTVMLYLHESSVDSDEDYTQASSLLENKPNVSSELYEMIQMIDLADFITKNELTIELVKMDIEGYEVELINYLIDTGAIEHINKLYVETHERKFAELKIPTDKLKERIVNTGFSSKFSFEWH